MSNPVTVCWQDPGPNQGKIETVMRKYILDKGDLSDGQIVSVQLTRKKSGSRAKVWSAMVIKLTDDGASSARNKTAAQKKPRTSTKPKRKANDGASCEPPPAHIVKRLEEIQNDEEFRFDLGDAASPEQTPQQLEQNLPSAERAELNVHVEVLKEKEHLEQLQAKRRKEEDDYEKLLAKRKQEEEEHEKWMMTKRKQEEEEHEKWMMAKRKREDEEHETQMMMKKRQIERVTTPHQSATRCMSPDIFEQQTEHWRTQGVVHDESSISSIFEISAASTPIKDARDTSHHKCSPLVISREFVTVTASPIKSAISPPTQVS